jgi:hypothetical protein
MAKQKPIQDVVEEMFQSVLATPRHQRRLRSKTFWDNFGFKVRTKDRVSQVKDALHQRGMLVNFEDGVFGTEDKDEWIILTYVEPPRPPTQGSQLDTTTPMPSDEWFDLIASREFESEREVEYYFVVPVLEQLGFSEADFAIGFPVQMYEGVKKVNKEADFVLFKGPSRAKEDALLIVEAKKTDRILTDDSVGQARAYALWLSTPYYLVTNGEEVRLYLFRGAIQPDVMLMTFKRQDFRQHWAQLYQTLSKDSVMEYKDKLSTMLAGVQR